jgi:glutamate-1-semialdehyde 2,1-aminomutase
MDADLANLDLERIRALWETENAGLAGASSSSAATRSISSPPSRPSTPRDRARADDPDLRALIRVFMINRGVWESGWWLGPSVSVAHTEANVDRYVEVFGEFLAAATG